MTYTVYFTAAETNRPTQEVAKEYLKALGSAYGGVGVFRFFTSGPIEENATFLGLLQSIGRREDAERVWGTMCASYVVDEGNVMNATLWRYSDYARDFDTALIVDLLEGGPVLPGPLDRAGRAAAHLGCSLVMLVPGDKRMGKQVATVMTLAVAETTKKHAFTAATVVVGASDEVRRALSDYKNSPMVLILDAADPKLTPQIADTLLEGTAKGSDVITPPSFTFTFVEKARSNRQRVVLPESEDDRILYAAAECLEREIADIMILGKKEKIDARAVELGLDLAGARTISTSDPELLDKYATEFARLRAKKGVTYEQVLETVKDASYFDMMMVHMDGADGMVSGAAHTTAYTIIPSSQIIKMKPGTSIVSSVFLMLVADRVHAYGDCVVNINPTPEQLINIAVSSAKTVEEFGVDPKVAMLSYSTGDSGKGPDVDVAVEATRLARELKPDLLIEGSIQYDAAVDAVAAAKKPPNSPAAGRAAVLVFPSLNAGNIGYKAVQRMPGATVVGLVLQGLNKSVNDLSRGVPVEDIVNTIAATAAQAQQPAQAQQFVQAERRGPGDSPGREAKGQYPVRIRRPPRPDEPPGWAIATPAQHQSPKLNNLEQNR